VIGVRESDKLEFVKFSGSLRMRFSLERPPSGLFARLLMRNSFLQYPAWAVEIRESCEAMPYLFASVHRLLMDAKLFHTICDQIHHELDLMDKELHDKFRYDVERPVATGHAASDPDIRFIEPAPTSVSNQIRARVMGAPKQLPSG